MRLFDTHAHLDEESFDNIRTDVIERAREAGVDQMLAVGTTAASSMRTVEIANRFEGVYAAVGIQPNYCAEMVDGDWDRIVALSTDPAVIAIGETGLDRYWDHSPFDLQQDYFDRHLRLSEIHQKPFIVHMRECESDIMKMLREAHKRGPLLGVMHSYTGDAQMAAECIEMGMYISFAGMVTFKKSTELRSVAAEIPADRILIETDSPYLSPEPMRSRRPNEPARVVHTATCLAETRGQDLEQFARQTTANACRLFGLTAVHEGN